MDDTNALAADVRTVVELASLAPSVHNTQPWRFTWDGRTLSVFEDPSRALPVLDPSGRERVLSCGAAVLLARIAFAELGWAVDAAVRPRQDDPHLVARLTVTGRREATEEEHALAQAVPRRTTDRDPFDTRRLPESARAAIAAAAEAEGAWTRFVGDESDDAAVELQVLLSHADDSQRSDPAYLAELAAWRRDREAEGIPARALPSVPVELRGSSWVPRDFRAGEAADEAAGAPAARPAGGGPAGDPPPAEHPDVLVLGTPGDGPDDWVTAGQALARVLLRATVDGIAAQPLTQVLEVPVLRARMRHVLGVVGHPQILLRLGYGHAGPTSRRRAVDDVLTVVPAGGNGAG